MSERAAGPELAVNQVQSFVSRVRAIREGLHQAIVGQDETIDLLLSCALTGLHALLVGVPGLAKTLMVKALASALDWKFARIQFTPDLMPADITGYELLGRAQEDGSPAICRSASPKPKPAFSLVPWLSSACLPPRSRVRAQGRELAACGIGLVLERRQGFFRRASLGESIRASPLRKWRIDDPNRLPTHSRPRSIRHRKSASPASAQ